MKVSLKKSLLTLLYALYLLGIWTIRVSIQVKTLWITLSLSPSHQPSLPTKDSKTCHERRLRMALKPVCSAALTHSFDLCGEKKEAAVNPSWKGNMQWNREMTDWAVRLWATTKLQQFVPITQIPLYSTCVGLNCSVSGNSLKNSSIFKLCENLHNSKVWNHLVNEVCHPYFFYNRSQSESLRSAAFLLH